MNFGHELRLTITLSIGLKLCVTLGLGPKLNSILQLPLTLGLGLKFRVLFVSCNCDSVMSAHDSSGHMIAAS